jgi:hypothetical protein
MPPGPGDYALAGLQRLGDPTLPPRAVAMLDDPDVQVQAAALVLVLATPGAPAYAGAASMGSNAGRH